MDTKHRPSDLDWSERVEGRHSELVLTPSRMAGFPLLVFAGIWDSFLVTFYAGLSRAHAPTFAFVFPLLHAGVGVFVTWLALTRTLNRSRITLTPAELVLEHSPVPAPGARLATSSIERFEAASVQGRRGERWLLRALTRDGVATKLSLPLESAEHFTFVAARLNEALALAKGPVGYRDNA